MTYETVRDRVFHLLEADGVRSGAGRLIDAGLAVLIVANALMVVLESDEDLAAEYGDAFFVFEAISVLIFTVEYGLRVWSCTSQPHLAQLGPLKARLAFMGRPFSIIDLLAILPFYLAFFFTIDLRMLRVLRLLRLLKLARYSPALTTLARVVVHERRALAAALLVMVILLLFAATAMHHLEADAQPEAFGSIGAALWWALATLTTVGYGDVVPVTTPGRIVGGLFMILGLGVFAVPIGLLATAFQQEIGRREFVVTWGMIARVPLFSLLRAAEVAEIITLLNTRRVRRNDVIMSAGERADEMFFLVSGEVELTFGGNALELDEGDFFGERAILDQGIRKASAVARTDAVILVLDSDDLRRLMDQHPEIETRIRTALDTREEEASGAKT